MSIALFNTILFANIALWSFQLYLKKRRREKSMNYKLTKEEFEDVMCQHNPHQPRLEEILERYFDYVEFDGYTHGEYAEAVASFLNDNFWLTCKHAPPSIKQKENIKNAI